MKKRSDKNGEIDPEGVWRKVAATVKAYGKKLPLPAGEGRGEGGRGSRVSQNPGSVPLSPTPLPQGEGLVNALDESTRRKLKRGKIEIDGKLDLHGMTQAEAYAALTRFITASQKKSRRTLLVITGKGRAPGSGVLKRMLPLWAAEFPAVMAVSPASLKDGGEGAFYLRLRKQK